MTTIEHVTRLPFESVTPPPLDDNPFTDEDALFEAQILDIRMDALRSETAVLFEARTAANYFDMADTGLLVAHGVTNQTWDADARPTGSRTAWTVLGSVSNVNGNVLELDLSLFPNGEFRLRATSAAFYVGNVGLPNEIPDYGERTDAELRRMLPQWDSEFEVVGASSLTAAHHR